MRRPFAASGNLRRRRLPGWHRDSSPHRCPIGPDHERLRNGVALSPDPGPGAHDDLEAAVVAGSQRTGTVSKRVYSLRFRPSLPKLPDSTALMSTVLKVPSGCRMRTQTKAAAGWLMATATAVLLVFQSADLMAWLIAASETVAFWMAARRAGSNSDLFYGGCGCEQAENADDDGGESDHWSRRLRNYADWEHAVLVACREPTAP